MLKEETQNKLLYITEINYQIKFIPIHRAILRPFSKV